MLAGKACAFIHDEIVSDATPEQADEVATGQEHWMKKSGEEISPEINWQVVSVAMGHMSKKAKTKHGADGKLIVDYSH
jgi:hypothetical protein